MKEYSMIRLKRTTIKRLKELGKKGDTYDNVILKLLGEDSKE